MSDRKPPFSFSFDSCIFLVQFLPLKRKTAIQYILEKRKSTLAATAVVADFITQHLLGTYTTHQIC